MKYRNISPFFLLLLLLALSPTLFCSDSSGRLVTDMAGRRVLIPQDVQRVITAGGTPAVNAFIFAIGRKETIKNGLPLAMRTKRWKYQTVFAPFIKNQPVVSASEASIWSLNLEAILAIPHDIIFVDNELSARMLEKKGFTAISLNWRASDCVRKTMMLMGEIFNQRNKAQEFAEFYQRSLSIISNDTSGIPNEKRPHVLYIRTKPMALVMPSTSRYLIRLAGGIYGVQGMIPENATISMEQLIAWNPDFLLVGDPAEVEYIYHNQSYSYLKAVNNRKVYVVPVGAHPWTNYTPEQSIALLWLAKLIYPDRFKEINITDEMKYFYSRFFGYSLTDIEVNEILTQKIQ